MLYLCLALFLLSGWFLPWWALGLLSLALGFVIDAQAWKVFLAGFVAWLALAFVLDGRSHGLISQRMSGLFSLPSPYLFLVVTALVGGVTAALCFKAGSSLKP